MEITVLCEGDSNDISLWSNFPYFVTKGIEENGIVVNRVNLYDRPHIMVKNVFDKTLRRIAKFFIRNTTFKYDRTALYHFMINRRLKKAVINYPKTDLFICLSFSFNPAKYTNKPCIMMCDWTYEFSIEKDLHKSIDWFEHFEVERQIKNMRNAAFCVYWRRECESFIRQRHPEIRIKHINNKVVNCMVKSMGHDFDYIENKFKSSTVLFMGAPRYLSGAIVFYNSVIQLINEGSCLKAYIIGISEELIKDYVSIDDRVICIGYLRKGVEKEKNTYYDLIRSAKICVNTTQDFVSIASLMECQYMSTPVIVSRNKQTEYEYGSNNDFVIFCDNNTDDLKGKIQTVLNMDKKEYTNLCHRNFDYYKNASWKCYIRELIDEYNT